MAGQAQRSSARRLVHGDVPPLGYAWLAGAFAGATLLVRSLRREQTLREGECALWEPVPGDHPTAQRFEALVAASSLDRPPDLGWVDSPEPNAFAVGRSRDEASIVVTAGLIERLQPTEMDAVFAQQIAQVESEGLKAVGLADAVADSIGDLSRTRGRFFWGPRAILAEMWPFLLVFVVGFLVLP